MIYELGECKPTLVGNEHFIAPTASVLGSVVVQNLVSVWFNVVIRADNDCITLGERTNVQDGAILHTDPGYALTLGRGVTVGHCAMLHGCCVGDYSLIGINAVVLNGAQIGSHCLIGANALVTENQKIPEGSLVLGSPAKVVKSLSVAQIEQLELSAEVYVANLRRYRQQLNPCAV